MLNRPVTKGVSQRDKAGTKGAVWIVLNGILRNKLCDMQLFTFIEPRALFKGFKPVFNLLVSGLLLSRIFMS